MISFHHYKECGFWCHSWNCQPFHWHWLWIFFSFHFERKQLSESVLTSHRNIKLVKIQKSNKMGIIISPASAAFIKGFCIIFGDFCETGLCHLRPGYALMCLSVCVCMLLTSNVRLYVRLGHVLRASFLHLCWCRFRVSLHSAEMKMQNCHTVKVKQVFSTVWLRVWGFWTG